MSDRVVALVRDRERFAVAFAVALTVHAAVLSLFSPHFADRPEAFHPPIHVSFPPVDLPLPPETADRTVPEAVPPAEPDAPEITPEVPVEPAPDLARGQEPASAPTAAPRATATTPTVEDFPTASDTTAPVSAPPQPRPEPARSATRTFDPAAEPDLFVARSDTAAQLADVLDVQAAYAELLNDYRAAQEERELDGTRSESGPAGLVEAAGRIADRIAALERSLVAENQPVLRLGPENESNTRNASPGVTIDGPGGSRSRIDDTAPLDLEGLELPVYFPPEYLADVAFSVDAGGSVISARLRNPSGIDELDPLLERYVRSWRFQAAQGAPVVEGRVFIVVSTRVVR